MAARWAVFAVLTMGWGLPAWAAPGVEVVARIALPGAASWSAMQVDSAGQRLYLAHGSGIDVIDTRSNQRVGTVSDTSGVRAIAVAPDLGLGYASHGKADSVTVFDLNTLARKSTMPAGSGPDALVYDRAHQRLLVFNTRSEDISVIDARSGTALATVAIGGEPESAVLGSDGLVYFNVENTDEMVVFDPSAMRVVRRHALRPCSRPTAMAIGAAGKVYTVCHNDMLVAVAGEGRVLGTVPFGRSSDSVATLGDLAYSAAGADGTLRIVGSAGGGAAAIGTLSQVTTAYGSRTVAADPATRQLYLPAARFSPEEGGQRRQALPDSLSVWVLQPR